MDKLKELFELVAKYPFLFVGVILILLAAVGILPLGVGAGSVAPPIGGNWRLVLSVIGLAGVAFDGARLWRQPSGPQSLAKATGGIMQPAANSVVGRAISATGWSRDIDRGLHLWLIVEVDNHKWPKGDELQTAADGTWRSDVYEDGTGADVFARALRGGQGRPEQDPGVAGNRHLHRVSPI